MGGISATYINSSLSSNDYAQTIQNIYHDIYKIIYVAPERFLSESFIKMLDSLDISMIAIDEAHCVSQWGHDFRPSYCKIAEVIDGLKKRPIITAFTSTATKIVKDDIIKLLKLNNPFVLTTGFDRENLYFSVQSPSNKFEFTLDFLNKHKGQSGIIYCSTKKGVDGLFEKLSKENLAVSKYHGGMGEKARATSQDDFVYDRCDIMVATNAFGMGIDKSNVRFVLHYNMPSDLESYYQEAGRAGRDGDDAECVLLFSRADIVTAKFLIENSSFDDGSQGKYEKLNDMVDYCNTSKCLRKYILEYFGESPKFDSCNYCSNCNSQTEVTDITVDSKKILSCIKRMNERFGAGLVTDVLKGSNSAKVSFFDFSNLSTYGIMKEYSKETIRDLISFLVAEGYIKSVGDKYPVLVLTELANEVLFKGKTVVIKKKIDKSTKDSSPSKTSKSDTSTLHYDADLFEILRTVRREIAVANKIPPFIVFGDVSLKQMAAFAPCSKEDFLKISGVGDTKLKLYGSQFIEAISNYVSSKSPCA